MHRLPLLLVFLPAVLAGAAGCGPSYHVLYQGDVHFERCYALEEDPNQSLEAKSVCWHTYVANYSYGQTRDRIRYAGIREQALARAPELPTDEIMMQAAPGVAAPISLNTPTPKDAFTPPPQTMDPDRAGGIGDPVVKRPPGVAVATSVSPTASTPAQGPRPVVAGAAASATPTLADPPQTPCAAVCGDTWKGCRTSCAPRAGHECEACDRTYKGCMKGCFK